MEEIKLGIQIDNSVNNLEKIDGVWYIIKRDSNGKFIENLGEVKKK